MHDEYTITLDFCLGKWSWRWINKTTGYEHSQWNTLTRESPCNR